MPKAVYCSGSCDKRDCPRLHSKLGPVVRPLQPADDGNNDGDIDAMVVILIDCPIPVESII